MATMSETNRGTGKPEEQGTAKADLLGSLRHYFTELRFEWKKISFPSTKELQQSTVVVFVFTLLVMGIISLFDLLVSSFFMKFVLPQA